MEELRRQVEEHRRLTRQAQRERDEAQRERDEAKRERDEAKVREEAERKEKEAAQKAIEKTTLKEYLRYCHIHLFKLLAVETDRAKTTGGGTTAVEDKYYPLHLRPWEDFIETQERNFKTIKDVLGDERLFNPEVGIKTMQSYACGSPMRSEEDIKPFELLAVEGPVKGIISALFAKSTHPALQPFKVSRVSFTNHSHTISPKEIGSGEIGSEEIQSEGMQSGEMQSGEMQSGEMQSGEIPNEDVQRRRRQFEPIKEDASNPKPPKEPGLPGKPDRFCIREDLEGQRTAAFIIEYKAAHKVQVEDLRRALSKKTLFTEAINRTRSSKTSPDSEDKADTLVAKIMTQTFDYMIGWDLEYSYFTAGKSLVFLRVKDDDPKTVYYHMIAPNEDAEGEDESQPEIFLTAVAQVPSFCLMALQSTRLNRVLSIRQSQEYRDKVYKKLQKWPDRYPEASDESSDEEESSQATQTTTQSTQSFVGPSSPITNPQTHQLRSKSSCLEAKVIRDDDDGDDDSDDSREAPRAAPGGAGPLNKRRQPASRSSSSGDDGASSETESQTRQYCTLGCLLGLKRGWTLDEKCPNVSSHRTLGSGAHHPVDVASFARLVREQLGRDRDRDCEPLGKYGARGALFKLTLARYGYTFVGKGTLSVFVRALRHEGEVYRRLERLQGEVVPVYLGNIDLIKTYYLPGVHIVHMLLMSWAGEKAAGAGVPDLAGEVRQTSRAVRSEGVVHGDERDDNMLWNPERRRVMLVDFERSYVLPVAKHKQLLKLSGRKRKQLAEEKRMLLDSRVHH